MSKAEKSMVGDEYRQAAIDWFVRGRTTSSPLPAAELQAWLEADPEHAEAYAEVERLWAATTEVEKDPEIHAWKDEIDRGLRRHRFGRRAIAAGIAAAFLGLSATGVYQFVGPKPLVDQSFRTTVGQQATVTLPDGSVLTLNTDTLVRTRADAERRLVYLDKGQAFFKVAKDRRHPFVVAAAGRTVTALGTAFDVRVERGGLKVVLVEGKVRVENLEAPAPAAGRDRPVEDTSKTPTPIATEMLAGSELVASADSDWRVTRADVERDTSWLSGQIVIKDQPLVAAIEELNRYSRRKIVLGDPALAEVRVSGVFRPGDIDGFARALKTSGLAQVGPQTNGEFRIVAMK